jgi:hypothetical protein
VLNAAELAGVAQLGQSVRLIIERSRARVPPPAPQYVIITDAIKKLFDLLINCLRIRLEKGFQYLLHARFDGHV